MPRSNIAIKCHFEQLPPLASTAAVLTVLDGIWTVLVGVAVSRCSKANDEPVAMVAMGSEALALLAETAPIFCDR